MTKPETNFVYVTYIRTPQEKLWEALTTPAFMKSYWFGMEIATDWTVGGPWQLLKSDGSPAAEGRIVALDRPNRLALTWRDAIAAEAIAEGDSNCVIELAPQGDATKLTITHSIAVAPSELIARVSGGWPRVISNLKSLLETGEVALA